MIRLRRRRERTRGQGLVEFALVIPIFLLAVFGLIDVGRLVYLNSTLSQAAREAARLGAVEASWVGSGDPGCNQPSGPVCPSNVSTLITHMQTAANRMMTPFGSVSNLYIQCQPRPADRTVPVPAPAGNWTGNTCTNRNPEDVLFVRVTATYTGITPVAAQLVGTLTLSGSSTFVIN